MRHNQQCTIDESSESNVDEVRTGNLVWGTSNVEDQKHAYEFINAKKVVQDSNQCISIRKETTVFL